MAAWLAHLPKSQDSSSGREVEPGIVSDENWCQIEEKAFGDGVLSFMLDVFICISPDHGEDCYYPQT